MGDLERTRLLVLALFELLLALVSHLPGFAMARVAEVVRAETEVEGHRAAEAALVVDELLLVLLAEGVPVLRPLEHVRGALGTDELLGLVLQLGFLLVLGVVVRVVGRFLLLLLLLLCGLGWGSALAMAAEVGILALVALVVVKVIEGELGQIVKVLTLGVFESLIEVHAFMLCAKDALIQDLRLQVFGFLHFALKPLMTRRLHPLVAGRTVSVLETDREIVPPLVQPGSYTVHVKEMLAT